MYLFVCALCMFINGVLAAGAKLKSIRYNTQYTVFENKLFIVIFLHRSIFRNWCLWCR